MFDGGSVGGSEGRHTGTHVGFACVHTALHTFGKGRGRPLRGSRARRGAMWLALWRPSSRSASSTPPSPVATGGAMVARRDVRHRRPIIAASLRIAAPSACHGHAARDILAAPLARAVVAHIAKLSQRWCRRIRRGSSCRSGWPAYHVIGTLSRDRLLSRVISNLSCDKLIS